MDTDKQTFNNMKALCAATGEKLSQIKIAKGLDAPGFSGRGTINWTMLKPWMESNRALLERESVDSYDYYKKEDKKRDIQIKDETLRKLKGEVLDVTEANKVMLDVGTALNAILDAQLLTELPEKLEGKSSSYIKEQLRDVKIKIAQTINDKNVFKELMNRR